MEATDCLLSVLPDRNVFLRHEPLFVELLRGRRRLQLHKRTTLFFAFFFYRLVTIEQKKESQILWPNIGFSCECYHMETRTRTRTEIENGQEVTKTEHMKRKVLSRSTLSTLLPKILSTFQNINSCDPPRERGFPVSYLCRSIWSAHGGYQPIQLDEDRLLEDVATRRPSYERPVRETKAGVSMSQPASRHSIQVRL